MSLRPTSATLTLALLSSCVSFPPNDNGDEAFVVNAIEVILGRKPIGSAEVEALADLARASGREAVLAVLFEQPEYVDYWSNVLADDLQVQRTGAMAVDADCLAPPLLPPDLSDELAYHLATADPAEEFCWSTIQVREPPWFSEDVFFAAYDAAESAYEFTRADEIEVPEPLEAIVEYVDPEKDVIGALDAPEALDDDLLRGGSARTNGNFVADGLVRKDVLDTGRWDDLVVDLKECAPFNLTDALQAAVRADRLDGVYRAYLPVLATFPASSYDREAREGLSGLFFDAVLDRDPTCMTCHTSTFSTTNPKPSNANWDRFYPAWYDLRVPLDPEGTVFSSDFGPGTMNYGGDGGTKVRDQVSAFFRLDNHAPSGGLRPFGMDEVCVTNPDRGFDGFETSLGADPLGETGVLAGRVGDDVGVLDLVRAFSDGTSTLPSLSFRLPDWAGERAARGVSASPSDPGCTGCHSGTGAAPSLPSVVPFASDMRLFSIVRYGSGRMPPLFSDDASAWDAVEWVRQNYPHSPAYEFERREHGFVFLAAAATVNRITDEVLGEDLGMFHGFPRNQVQADVLSHLTQTYLQRFSLRDVLTEMVMSEALNRRSPADPSTVPYNLPFVALPEAAVGPTSAPLLENSGNSEGDGVHKHSTVGLVHQVAAALGWPAPGIRGYLTVYPNQETMDALGRYSSRAAAEREGFTLDTYLAWEANFGACQKPPVVYAKDVRLIPGTYAMSPWEPMFPEDWEDWIDRLVEENASAPFTWSELAIRVKDRLLGDPALDQAEEALLADLWSVDLGHVSIQTAGDEEIEAHLRELCGAVLASPRFVLQGIRPAGPTPSIDNVCRRDEACSRADRYEEYADLARDLGYDVP